MKRLFQKPWVIGLFIIVLMIIVFFINLLILTLPLDAAKTNKDILWVLAGQLSDGENINIVAYVFMIAFYVSILPILLSGYSFLRKNHWGFVIALIYFLGLGAGFIVFQALYGYLTIYSIILAIISIVCVVIMFILFIFRKKALSNRHNLDEEDISLKLSRTKIPLFVLIVDILSVIAFITTFFIPLYSMEELGLIYHATIINVLLSGDTNLEVIIYFIVNFFIFLCIFLYFAKVLSYYFFDKKKFIKISKTLITIIFIGSILFFVMGLSLDIYYTIENRAITTISFIPMLLICLVIFIFAILRGIFNAQIQYVDCDSEVKYARVEILFYVILMTAVTSVLLLLNILKLEISYESYTNTVELTGLVFLKDYAILDPSYRMVAFLLIVMLLSVGLCLLVTLTSYLSKHKQFTSIVKLAIITNFFFVFIFAVSGYYFQIGKEINQAVFIEIFNSYGYGLLEFPDYEYKISTDAIYALIGSVAILILMFIRKAFDRDSLELVNASGLPFNQPAESIESSSSDDKEEEQKKERIEEDVNVSFDPCPAFSDLDSKANFFNQDLNNRKEFKTQNSSLSDLIHFVVEYAKNSRLHLSYTPEDIATFVAGLGACKLSILQGMSGTGKTSLPKIFSEAVLGNCEIIEVESSWKDKNELLGYYNEFSMKYNPKKFTLALYKAALNKEIATFILLDEMNLSRIEYYFSDFLSLMEHEEDKREIKLINIKLNRREDNQDVDYLALEDGNTLKVPANIWFIGTANRDESTFVISDKVYDRAHTINFTKRAPKVRNYSSPIPKQFYDYETINNLLVAAKEKGNFDAENSELIKSVEALLAPYNISFGNRILKQIEEFVNIYKECFVKEDVEKEAIERILLSKVVAKLEVKTIDDKEKLEMEFVKLNLNQCAAFLKRLDND